MASPRRKAGSIKRATARIQAWHSTTDTKFSLLIIPFARCKAVRYILKENKSWVLLWNLDAFECASLKTLFRASAKTEEWCVSNYLGALGFIILLGWPTSTLVARDLICGYSRVRTVDLEIWRDQAELLDPCRLHSDRHQQQLEKLPRSSRCCVW